MYGIHDIQKFLDLRSDAVIIFREYSLEYGEVVLGHLIYNFVVGLNEIILYWVLGYVKDRRL